VGNSYNVSEMVQDRDIVATGNL